MRVLLATSTNAGCGIAEHSRMLIESCRGEGLVRKVDFHYTEEALDPEWAFATLNARPGHYQVLHLNHHDGLHSRWTPKHVADIERMLGIPVVVTYHDTREDHNNQKLLELATVASAIVVHEPTADLIGTKIHYWRQGVPAAAQEPAVYWDGVRQPYPWKKFPQQPVLGTVGHDFPWKNYDRIAEITRAAGWAFLLCCPSLEAAREDRVRELNPSTLIARGLPTDQVVNALAGCDATAFLYTCANTGTSGAIRLGIAARKPVIALEGCRQFRDLYQDHLGANALAWIERVEDLQWELQDLPPRRIDPLIHALAEQESWEQLGRKYVALYQEVVR